MFSVVIPLFNKQAEIARCVESVLEQSLLPAEIIVIDDGSTDRGAEIVEGFNSRLIKLVRQRNQGVSVARNCGVSSASGDYYAFLDADDWWESNYLQTVAGLIAKRPNCGLYCTGFNVVDESGVHPAKSPAQEGVIQNFFRESMGTHIALTSACVVSRVAWESVGGFPEGMKLGEDQYLWTKIALQFPVCFSPHPLMNYSVTASNRSTSIYEPEQTQYRFRDFFDPSNNDLNEFIARCEIGRATTFSVRGCTAQAREVEHFYRYTRLNRRMWVRLWVLNRLPHSWRGTILNAYNALAWRLSRKGI